MKYRLLGFSSEFAQKAYYQERLKLWEDHILLVLIVNILYFTYRAGNYFYAGYEYSSAIRNDIVMGISLMILSIGRRFCVRYLKVYKQVFMFWTDIIAIVLFTIFPYLVKRNLIPYTLGYSTAYPLSLDFFILYLLIVPFFYIWYMPVVGVIITLIYYIVTENTYYMAPMAGLVLHSVSVLVGIIVEAIMVEKLRRASFEAQFSKNKDQRLWEDILNNLPGGVMLVEKNKNIRFMNDFLADMLKLTKFNRNISLDEIKEFKSVCINAKDEKYKNFFDAMGKLDERPDSFNLVEIFEMLMNKYNSLNNGEDFTSLRGTLKGTAISSDRTIEIKFTVKKIYDQHSCLFIFNDITDRILVTSLQETIEYKNRLLASVSHELRTPLNGSINFIQQVVEDPRVPNDLKDSYLVPSIRSSKFLLTIINDILDFSQIHANTLKLVPIKKSLVQTAMDSLQLIEVQAKRKSLYTKLDLPEPKWDCEILTDHNRLMQVITNLLSNALKFTFQGGIKLKIEVDHPKVYLISVTDTGIGIAENNQKKLFKAFSKIDLGNDNTMNSQGVGLGLVISNALARMIGPSKLQSDIFSMHFDNLPNVEGLSFESEPGKGSTFSFRVIDQSVDLDGSIDNDSILLSSLMSEAREARGDPHESIMVLLGTPESHYLKRSTTKSGQKRCECPDILIVDDDGFNILALETALKGFNKTSQACYNGMETLEVVEQRKQNPCSKYCKPFRLIFLDCNMPIMDGYETASKLNELFEKNPDMKCPIVACTAFVSQEEKTMALKAGMDDYCTKPISRSQILRILKQFLDYSKKNSLISPIKIKVDN